MSEIDFQIGDPEAESQLGEMLPDDKVEEIIQEVEAGVVIPEKTEHPFIFAPVGLVGSGKSTVTNLIAREFNLIRISADDIREVLTRHGYNLRRSAEIAYLRAKKYLEQGYGVAIDADVVRASDLKIFEQASEMFKIPVFIMHINTPEEVILQRLDENNQERKYKGREAQAVYFRRKALHENLPHNFTHIYNGAGDLKEEFEKAKAKINEFVGKYYSKT